MLIRESDGKLLAVGQASHAWLSGQLARAWGNDDFGSFEPHEEVCLAAEQHDIGMAVWDLVPSFNEEKHRPHTFLDVPREIHVRLWDAACSKLLTQSRYAALLVSMHGTGLYDRFGYRGKDPEVARLIEAFMKRQQELQKELLDSLQADAVYAPVADEATVTRNRTLIAVWDGLSLALCHGLDEPKTIDDVPAAEGATDIVVSPRGADEIGVSPWPFGHDRVTVRFEGRELATSYSDASALEAAARAAPWRTISIDLVG